MNLERLSDILEEELGVERSQITPNSNIKVDLGADSLDLFELISKIEDEEDITVAEADYDKLKTVQDIIDYTENK